MGKRSSQSTTRPTTVYQCNSVCPHCLSQHDYAMPTMGNDRPKIGDLSLCMDCGEWNLFDRPGLRKLTDGEMFKFSMAQDYPRMARAQVLAKLRARFGSLPDAIVSVNVDSNGAVKSVTPMPPESLDNLI